LQKDSGKLRPSVTMLKRSDIIQTETKKFLKPLKLTGQVLGDSIQRLLLDRSTCMSTKYE
jgi:hypothetical protein